MALAQKMKTPIVEIWQTFARIALRRMKIQQGIFAMVLLVVVVTVLPPVAAIAAQQLRVLIAPEDGLINQAVSHNVILNYYSG